MWNYSYILPSTMILLIFLLYFFLRTRLPLRMNSSFVMLLLADLLTILSDYFSTIADEAYQEHSVSVLYGLNMAFFVLFILRTYLFTRFTFDAIEMYAKVPVMVRRFTPAILIILELIALSSPVTHAIFYIDSSGYHSGPLYLTLAVCGFFYSILALVVIFAFAGKLPPKVIAPLIGCHMILILGNIIRILVPHILIMDTFCLMSIIILYLSFENPDRYLTDRGTSFTWPALQLLLNEWHGNRPYYTFGFIIHNYNEHRTICGGPQMENILLQIEREIYNTFPHTYLFYLEKGRFLVFFPQEPDKDDAKSKVRDIIDTAWSSNQSSALSLDVSFVEMDSEEMDYTPDRIIVVLLIALEEAAQSSVTSDKDKSANLQVIREQLVVKHALDTALENDSVEIYLQPLVDSSTGSIVAAEALARIKDPEHGIISPVDFIPVAEKNSQINQLGEQVFRKVCLLFRDHDLESLGLTRINVNLSPYQLGQRDLALRYGRILEDSGVLPALIPLEITEQTLVDSALLQEQLHRLRQAGFSFVLDDYGSGYSNLLRLRQYPFRSLKIDMEVVWEYCRMPFPLLPAFIDTLKDMDIKVTAEGIEDENMVRIMTDLGCDYLQGYYYSKPLPAEEFIASLK